MNIINAAFVRNGVTVRTLPVYQYNRGMILNISGLDDLPSTFRADFANTETGQSKSVIGTDGEVHIPYEYFVPGATIHCWLVWSGEDYTVTRKHIMIPVARRATPTDEEPSPDEQGVIDQAIAALNDSVTQTGQDVDTAAGYAEQAEQSAQAAATAKDAAVTAKSDAEAAKDQAVQFAADAAASAQSASESAQSASQSKADAQAAAASVAGAMETLEATIQADLQAAKESGMFDGPQGPQGPKGDKGDTGATGPQGPKGDKGDKGDTGEQGAAGPKGDKGDTGAQGPKGDTGSQGPQGIQGEQGPKGDKGDTGATGPQGPQGEQGPKGDPGEVTQTEFDDLAGDVADLKSQIIITEEQHPYEPTADYGRYTDGSAYNDYIPNHKLNVDTGEYVEDLNHSQYYTSETYYEIPNDSQIFSYMKNQGITSISINYCFYAADKSYLGRSTWVQVTTKTSEWNGLYGEYVTIPSNAKYFRVWSGLSNNFHAVVLTRDITYLVNIPNLVIDKPLSDIRLLALGDSIWGNDRTDGIADFLSEYTGMTVYNGAIGGTRITGDRGNYSSPEYKPFDGVNLIHALVTGVWTDQDANVDSVVSYVKTSTLPMLKSLDLSTVDIITLAYGHNDFTAPKTIESIQAAFVTAIGEILTAYPQVRIVVIAPPWRAFDSGQTDGDVWTNENGNTLREVADAIVDCANSQHITSINMLNELPWRMDTAAYYLDSDKVHPNINGNRIYAHIIDGKIRSMY